MDEILDMIEICVDAHASHMLLYNPQWENLREWYEAQNDSYNCAYLSKYKFWRRNHKVIEVEEILPGGYHKFRLLIAHDYSEYTKEER